ncbi:MAG: redoxin family protein [Planctomycetota bacterium]
MKARLLPLLCAVCLCGAGIAAEDVTLRVTDVSGQPVAEAEVWARQLDSIGMKRIDGGTGEDGAVTLPAADHARLIVVKMPGHAPATATLDAHASEHTIRLGAVSKKILEVRTADGRPLPTGLKPAIYWEGVATDAWLSMQMGNATSSPEAFSAAPLVELSRDEKTVRFEVHLPAEGPEAHYLIDEPGFLRVHYGKLSDVASSQDDVDHRIELPAPGKLTLSLAPAPATKPDYEACGYELGLAVTLPPKDGWFFTIAKGEVDGVKIREEVQYLSPGTYQATLFSGRATERYQQGKKTFQAREAQKVAANETAAITASWVPFDPSRFRGEHSASISVATASGIPASGHPFTVTHYDSNYGYQTLHQGELDADGKAVIEGLAAGGAELTVNVDNMRVGKIALEASEPKVHDLSFSLPPSVGDAAPDLLLTDLDTGEAKKLSDFKGEVLFLDFWATWCGPCQQPMAHNQEVVTKRRDWEGKARILALSIDDDIETLRGHVERKGWGDVDHLFCSDGDPGWSCTAVSTYGVTGVPTALLVNQEGEIVWRGHPSGFDLEGRIDALLSGAGGQ